MLQSELEESCALEPLQLQDRGICLGFDVSANCDVQEPRYVDVMSACNSKILVQAALDSQEFDPADPSSEAVEMFSALLLTKFKDWTYEDEVRILLRLQEGQKDGKLYFANLDENIQPSMVILGARCSLTTTEIEELNAAIRLYAAPIMVVQAMLSPTHFEVVEDPDSQLAFRPNQHFPKPQA